MQAADAAAQQGGTPVEALMGPGRGRGGGGGRRRAGQGGRAAVVALAGKGHNGGDALEALARLAPRGRGRGAGHRRPGRPRRAGPALRGPGPGAGGRVRPFTPELAGRLLAGADLALDGLLGTGSSGAPRGAVAEAIGCAGAATVPVVAVDIPSGVDGASGEVAGEAVTAAVTVTFQAVKPGHVLPRAASTPGGWWWPTSACPWPGPLGVSEAADLADLVPVPQAELHKRSRGVLLLVGAARAWAGRRP